MALQAIQKNSVVCLEFKQGPRRWSLLVNLYQAT